MPSLSDSGKKGVDYGTQEKEKSRTNLKINSISAISFSLYFIVSSFTQTLLSRQFSFE
jgi:hypothetical protein